MCSVCLAGFRGHHGQWKPSYQTVVLPFLLYLITSILVRFSPGCSPSSVSLGFHTAPGTFPPASKPAWLLPQAHRVSLQLETKKFWLLFLLLCHFTIMRQERRASGAGFLSGRRTSFVDASDPTCNLEVAQAGAFVRVCVHGRGSHHSSRAILKLSARPQLPCSRLLLVGAMAVRTAVHWLALA
jgi:hypothetical protein